MCTTTVSGPRGVTRSQEDRSVVLPAAHAGLRPVDRTKARLSNCSPAAICACDPLRGSCVSLSVRDNDVISVCIIFIQSKKKKKISKSVCRRKPENKDYVQPSSRGRAGILRRDKTVHACILVIKGSRGVKTH